MRKTLLRWPLILAGCAAVAAGVAWVAGRLSADQQDRAVPLVTTLLGWAFFLALGAAFLIVVIRRGVSEGIRDARERQDRGGG